jgi:transglutaminase-like putative cysteine protease
MATSSRFRLRRLGATALLASSFAQATPDAGHPWPSSSFRQLVEIPGESLGRRLASAKSKSDSTDVRSFLVDVPKIVRQWRAIPPSQRHQSRVLADVRVDQLRSDYQSVEHVQQVIAIGAPADVGAYRTKSIEYSPQTQRLNVLRAVVHHPDGRSSKAEDLGESASEDPSTYDDAEKFRFRDLRAGDVIEFEYTISPRENQNPYGQYFAEIVAFGGPLPCDLQRYVLFAPKDIRLASAEHFLDHPDVRRQSDSDLYVWEKKDSAALVREPLSPSWSEQGGYVHVSNFANWQELAKWYGKLIGPQFELNDELRDMVSEIVARHPNRLDQIDAIEDLVLKRTRYVALELGVYRFKPYPVTQTFTRGFGDCKDKASLMVALLRTAGIDAELALLRTRELGEILPEPASASMFDHAVVYVPEFDLWLDGTAEFARLRELPVEDQGVMALTIDPDGKAALRRTPTSSATDNYSRRTINARLDADGTVHFAGATYVRGEDAPELRRELEPSDSKLGYVRDRLAQVLPAVEVRHVELPETAEAVSLNFDGDLRTFRGRRTATLPSSWMKRNYVVTLTPTSTRTQELRLDAPWTTEEEIHIQLPRGGRVAALPEDVSLQTDFGSAQITYRPEADEIVVLSTVQFNRTSIPVSEYSAFRDFTVSLEKAFSRNIAVNLP